MQMFRVASFVALFLCLGLQSVRAQMNLTSFYSRDVKQAIGVDTRVDSVQTSTTVAQGIATTIITLSVTPTPFASHYYNGIVPSALDSIEVTLHFWLPADYVAKNMWLWVNGSPQTGYIQDRNLASAQYNQIVGTRKDPALLETWGNGSYNFRMFPARLNVARKVAIEFQHAFDNDSTGFICARVPLSFDSVAGYWYGGSSLTKNIRYVQSSFTTADVGSYQVNVPGLGFGSFAFGQPLILHKSSVTMLGSATVSTTAPQSATSEYFWSGADKNARRITGCATLLAESTVVLDPEPDTRIIVLDIRQQYWDWDDYYKEMYAADTRYGGTYTNQNYQTLNIWLRAQKFAVLAVQNYVKPGQRFNVVFAGAVVKSLFPTPVAWSKESIAQAYAAIIKARPDAHASTQAALVEAQHQAGNGATILISDLYEPFDYNNWIYNGTTGTSTNSSPSAPAFDSLIATISRLIKTAEGSLFTITDCWQLSSIAFNNGGFNLSGLRSSYYYDYTRSADYDNLLIPTLPKLFGETGYYGQGISDIAVTGNLDSIVFTTEVNNYYYYRGPIMLDAMVKTSVPRTGLAKSTTLWHPYYSPRVKEIRIAGIVPPSRSSTLIDLTITGRMGGLGFTKKITGTWNSSAPLVPFTDNVQWAMVKSEELGNTHWYDNANAIKKIGIDYHIVTRQTSLLALEPGMVLWPDSNSETTNSTKSSGVRAAASEVMVVDQTYGNSVNGNNLDSASLEDLIAMNTSVVNKKDAVHASIKVMMQGNLTHITLPAKSTSGLLTIALYGLNGKLMSMQSINRSTITGTQFRYPLSPGKGAFPAGFYFLKVKLNGYQVTQKISLSR